MSNWFTQLGTASNNAMAQYGQAEITNAQANQAFRNAVIQGALAASETGPGAFRYWADHTARNPGVTQKIFGFLGLPLVQYAAQDAPMSNQIINAG